ncbi:MULTISPECIES: PilZ domain-containing protein [Acidithiobacillus]|nr:MULTISPECIES: PilZ domain-containing protein [Acidithiobacillus]AGF34141.1 type IV pilus assembly PilZ [uncultured bacterium DX-8J-22]ACH83636.1 type IV pilus assembly PilZ [Acidithiobacillus ferrooxidans ATCC 53993]MCR0970363.1 PilZ domain-containing protein [Acidithiobacillus ferrooxidans]MCR1341348.1 PilZ domain-containing protein [Acidithiobacillus ferrooxidans]MCR1349160.1 PilZ domain-containing protein [Acidithiobacillus ferrooxidans]
MSLTESDTELALILPHRSGLPLVEYLPLVFLSGADELPLPEPEALGAVEGRSAIVYGPEEDDDGLLCHAQGWDMGDLVLEPTTPANGEIPSYNKALIFLFAKPNLLGFFADWKSFQKGAHHFRRPNLVLTRRARQKQRLRLDGDIIVRRRNGSTLLSKLYDFGPSGASFYTDAADFRSGEMLLAEFEISGCGSCETTATIVRVETLSHSHYGYLVGIYFHLTKAQLQKAEQLYLCKKAEAIRQLSAPERHRWAPPETV